MKYSDGVLGGIENLAILMREECDTYHYSSEPEFTHITYKSCNLENGAEIEPTTGFIEIKDIIESKNDVQVILEYSDYLGKTKTAIISLGQEIKFSILSEDDHNPENYFISNCYLSITSKKYANETIKEHDKDIEKQYIHRKKTSK